jgi:IPTL-CTERM motif
MNNRPRLLALVIFFSLMYPLNVAFAQSPSKAVIVQPAAARIAGLPLTLRVQLSTLCFDTAPPFTQTSIVEVVKTASLITVRVTGYCGLVFITIDQPRNIALNSLDPGIYDVRYEFYNFDGSLVSEGVMPGYNIDGLPSFPFTVLAPTQENLDRVFRVPTLSQLGLAALALLIGVFGLRRFRKGSR